MIFRNWVLQNFPFLEDDFDALTDYELFCKMVEYMKKALDQLKVYDAKFVAFNERLTEIENYINDLDIQDAVNNKLDEMAESGELENLIGQYIELATTYVYNNVNEMKNATNLVNGSYARTSGFYNFNDEGGAYYKIRTITNEDVIDNIHLFALVNNVTLVAELIPSDKINIMQLGAYNDDDEKTSENTTIIQYALDNYKIVEIPIGDFYVGNLKLKQKTTLKGNSKLESKLIYNDSNNSTLIDTPDELLSEGHYIKIENLTLTNNEKTNIVGLNILTSYCNIENCYINLFENGIEIKHANNIDIKNNEILSNTNCGIKAIYTNVGHGQINAVYIHENNISWNKYGVMFSGNNVIIENNTIQANTDHAVCIGDPSWNNTNNESTIGSVIKDNYTELTGRDTPAEPIIIYSGYVSGRTYNRIVRDLVIKNNYFVEETSIVKLVTDDTSEPISKATEIIVENNYMNTTHPVELNFKNAISYGSIVKNNSPLGTDTNEVLPYYVIKDEFKKNTPEVLHNDNYVTMKSFYSGTNATNKQLTLLFYPKNIDGLTTDQITRTCLATFIKVLATGLDTFGDAGRYQARVEKDGGNTYDYDGEVFYRSRYNNANPNSPKFSPITVVKGHPNFDNDVYCGYQLTLLQPSNYAFPYNIAVEIMADPLLLQYYTIEVLTLDRNTSSGAPTNNASYQGQVCYDTTNSKWYVATNTTGTWREVSIN